MARIYNNRPAPSANKAMRPVVESKADAETKASVTATESTAEADVASADKPKGRPKKDKGSA